MASNGPSNSSLHRRSLYFQGFRDKKSEKCLLGDTLGDRHMADISLTTRNSRPPTGRITVEENGKPISDLTLTNKKSDVHVCQSRWGQTTPQMGPLEVFFCIILFLSNFYWPNSASRYGTLSQSFWQHWRHEMSNYDVTIDDVIPYFSFQFSNVETFVSLIKRSLQDKLNTANRLSIL